MTFTLIWAIAWVVVIVLVLGLFSSIRSNALEEAMIRHLPSIFSGGNSPVRGDMIRKKLQECDIFLNETEFGMAMIKIGLKGIVCPVPSPIAGQEGYAFYALVRQ